jgi:hypothetical protein
LDGESRVVTKLMRICTSNRRRKWLFMLPPYHYSVRDNSTGMPEIIDAYERDNQQFGAIRVDIADESVTLEFGIEDAGYEPLERILQSRPFAETPGVQHRYFFAGSASKTGIGSDRCRFKVRIEGGRGAKGFDFEGPISLAANLIWFANLKTLEDASALRRLS